jgi:hypothetical protein
LALSTLLRQAKFTVASSHVTTGSSSTTSCGVSAIGGFPHGRNLVKNERVCIFAILPLRIVECKYADQEVLYDRDFGVWLAARYMTVDRRTIL